MEQRLGGKGVSLVVISGARVSSLEGQAGSVKALRCHAWLVWAKGNRELSVVAAEKARGRGWWW